MTLHPSVLILTGERETRSLLSRIFSNNGWAVWEGAGRSDAAQCLSLNPSALIVTDRELPDGTWQDILALAHAVAPETRVLVTDPHADEALWADVLYSGGFDVLAQPLDEDEILRVSASAVRKAIARGAAAS